MPQTYWLDLFTVETWKEFLDHGGDVTGFREKRWKTVQKIKHGDYLLCYLTGASCWVGSLARRRVSTLADTPMTWNNSADRRIGAQLSFGRGFV